MGCVGNVHSFTQGHLLDSFLNICLAAPGLSYGMWDHGCGARAQWLWGKGLVTPQLVGSRFPDLGSYPRPLHWQVDSKPPERQGCPHLFDSYSHWHLSLLHGPSPVSFGISVLWCCPESCLRCLGMVCVDDSGA